MLGPPAMQARYNAGTTATLAMGGSARLAFLPPLILHYARYEVS